MDINFHNEVNISIGKVILPGELIIPEKALAIIIFSHGSGSSRYSIRNRQVAHYLHEKKFGTLLFDLLTPEEDQFYQNRFDIDLLTKRLSGATAWLRDFPPARGFRIGFFGASTGAASALKAAAALPYIFAVVSRGGRPDLAGEALTDVEAPTLLVVGSLDCDVIRLNEAAFAMLKGEKRMVIIKGASHLFEESGTMDKVCEAAGSWFTKYASMVKA